MSHTNSTTNYSLPQFVTTDKPAWLTDINGAFSAIDTGIYNAQTKANTADGNATQALSDASAASTAASTADAKGAGAIASIADTFQSTETYAVGDLVIYNNLLYKCTVAVTDPGAWTGSDNWARATVEGVIDGLTASDIEYSAGVSTKNAIDTKATNTNSNKMFKVVAFDSITKTATPNAGVSFYGNEFTTDTDLTGYSPIAAVSVYCQNGAWALNLFDWRNIGGSALVLKYRNVSATDQSSTISPVLLYIRNDLK